MKRTVLMMKRTVLVMIILVASLFSAVSQEISEKKEIAIFALGYRDWAIPQEALGLVDSQITEVFVNLGRFEVVGMTYRLSGADVNAFMGEIRRHKESTIEISEEVRLGEVTFTEADFNRLTNSFIVVIPIVSGYSHEKTVRKNDREFWEVELTTSFSFINVETMETFAYLNIETSGTGDTAREALHSASSSIASQLSFEVRSIPEFTLKTGVVEVLSNDRILLQFGRDMGVRRGDEFFLLRTKVLSSGHKAVEEEGLIKIEKVIDELSYGYVLTSNGKIAVGEQLKEIPRLGLEITPYGQALFDSGDFKLQALMAGLRFTLSRGVYLFRPVIGFEYLFGGEIGATWSAPVKFYVGGEFVFHLKRLALRPMLALGAIGVAPIKKNNHTDNFALTHFGGLAELRVSYLMLPGLRLYGSLGYSYWLGLSSSVPLDDSLLGDSYSGVTAGFGITFKL